MSESDEATKETIRERLAADRARGARVTLAEYQALYPSCDEIVRSVFEEGAEFSTTKPLGPSTVPSGHSSGLPQRIAHYVIEKELGRGGQGVVYLASDEKLKRKVALKVLIGLGGLSEDLQRRFEREATALSQLDHPAICTVYESDVVDGIRYIAMQYVAGESLAARIRAAQDSTGAGDGSFAFGFSESASGVTAAEDVDDVALETGMTSGPGDRKAIDGVVGVIETCARGLQLAHEAGLVHRDVKPGNIMITDQGAPVILDFGLAHVDDGGEPLTLSGDVLGTPAYMSPEQVAGKGHAVDGRTDVYSLGATLFECLTQQRPFQAPTREGLYRAILMENPSSPRKINPTVPRDLEVVLLTALEKDPRRRYATAGDFADELRRFLHREPVHARPAGPLLRIQRWAQRHPSLALALAALFCSLLAGLVVSLSFWRESERERERVTVQRDDIGRQKQEIERLADARIYDDLLRRERALWPPVPANVEALRRWLREALGLIDRLPTHEATLASLRRRALVPTEDELRQAALRHAAEVAETERRRDAVRAAWALLELDEERADSLPAIRRAAARMGGRTLEAQLEILEQRKVALDEELQLLEQAVDERRAEEGPSPPVRFADGRLQWRHDRLVELIENIRSLDGPSSSDATVAAITARVDDANTLYERSLGKHEDLWSDVIERIETSPGYEDFELEPQLGLVPLGRGASGVWEFAHVLSGDAPKRGPDGELILTEASGIVLSLLLGGPNKIGTITDPDRNAAELEGRVELDPYFFGKYEVTQAQWRRVMGNNPASFSAGVKPGLLTEDPGITGLHPIETVSYGDAMEFCRRLGLALPTECQWEVAARAGRGARFHWGEDEQDLEGRANVNGQENAVDVGFGWIGLAPWTDPWPVHAPVNATAENAYGLVGMFGNVGEWCRDVYSLQRVFASEPPRDGLNVHRPREIYRVYRGGTHQHPPIRSRVTLRNVTGEDQRAASIGLRAARPLDR